MDTPQNNAALIVAAGRGQRAGDGLPKQYRTMPSGGGENVLAHTIKAFAANEAISDICVVIHKDDVELYNTSINILNLNNNIFSVFGGETRQASVLNGLEALAQYQPDAVLIHDAARPFITQNLIDDCLNGLQQHQAVIPALPVTDTLKRAKNGFISETVARDSLFRAQTPQAFRFAAILDAHRAAPQGLTDDAAIAETAGLAVALIDGDPNNIKLTFEEDFMTQVLHHPRTGSGFDVHRFDTPGSAQNIMLGGIEVPHDCALIGHSDADVGLHAITDAILGGLAMGDIGDHFPPSDDTHKNRPSSEFLAHAVALASSRQAIITHIDLTLICELPKIGPHRDAMRGRIAELCGIDLTSVAVKATTTEGLGFTGRGEGIAAQAIATLLIPAAKGTG